MPLTVNRFTAGGICENLSFRSSGRLPVSSGGNDPLLLLQGGNVFLLRAPHIPLPANHIIEDHTDHDSGDHAAR